MEIKTAVCQIKINIDKKINLEKATNMIMEAAGCHPDMVILPEMFNCPYNVKYFKKYAETYPGKTTTLLSNLAKDLKIYIIGGSIPERKDNNIYNTSYTFDRNGNLIGKHQKTHLFDINIKNSIRFKESDYISYGKSITIFNTEFCKIGVAICYDMRFPELIRKMTLNDAKIVIVPAAFNMTTGPAHWHIITRTRALDNQIYFIAASPARDTESDYITYGHSLIVDPWGSIIAEADEKETILYGIIDLDNIHRIRKELPLLKHRREEIY